MSALVMNLSREKVLPLTQAARHPLLRQGRKHNKPVSIPTLFRWSRNRVRGVKLESFSLGGLRCTTEEALVRFLERLANPTAEPDAPTPSQINKADRAASAELAAAGL